MARPRQLDDDKPSNWRSGRVRPVEILGKSEGAGDIREQRGHEAQQGMLVSTEMERMKRYPEIHHWERPWWFHYQLSITITSPFLWHLNYSRVQIRDGVASRRTKVGTLTLTHSRCRQPISWFQTLHVPRIVYCSSNPHLLQQLIGVNTYSLPLPAPPKKIKSPDYRHAPDNGKVAMTARSESAFIWTKYVWPHFSRWLSSTSVFWISKNVPGTLGNTRKQEHQLWPPVPRSVGEERTQSRQRKELLQEVSKPK